MLPPGYNGLAGTQIDMLYRAGQLPYGYIVENSGPPVPAKVVNVKADVRNVQVLNALKKITGEDFGYDQRDWQRWWAVKQAAT